MSMNSECNKSVLFNGFFLSLKLLVLIFIFVQGKNITRTISYQHSIALTLGYN